MASYVLRRLLYMIPLLVGITFLAFLVIEMAPGDFFSTLKMNPSISPEAIHAMEIQFGYGDPLLLRYGKSRGTFAGVGIVPDRVVPADSALDVALAEIGARVQSR